MAARTNVLLCASAAAIVALVSIVGCTTRSLTGSQDASLLTVSGVGALPGSTLADPLAQGAVADSFPYPAAGPVGSRLAGNRVILIGDSIMTSISHRYGDQACSTLVPLGWQVEVDAETGRFIQFGHKVLDKRLSAGWDAAVILLGNNYLENRAQFRDQLRLLLARLAPRPTVLLTTTMFREAQANVNSAIATEAERFPNVTVVDWAAATQDSGLTGLDGLHLTERGRIKLANSIAAVLGTASGTGGKCLKTSFSDDSMGSPTGTNGSTGNAPKPKPSSSSTTTTAKSNSTASTSNSPTSTTQPTNSQPAVTTTTAPKATTTTPTTPPTSAPATTVAPTP